MRKKQTKKIIKKLPVKIESATIENGEVRPRKKKEGFNWLAKWKAKRNPATSYLVEIFNSNGTSEEFIVTTNKETFMIKNDMFYLRKEDSRFNLTMGEYKLYYDDDCPVPIDKLIIKKEDSSQTSELKKTAFFSLTPHNLKPFIKMEYVKNLSDTPMLDKMLKMLTILSLANSLMLALLIFAMFRGG